MTQRKYKPENDFPIIDTTLNKLLKELEGEGIILSQPLKNNKPGYTQTLEQIVRLAWLSGYTAKGIVGALTQWRSRRGGC